MTALLLLALPWAGPPSPVVDYSLRDSAGRMHRLADHAGKKVIVVVFVSVDCPLAKLYAPRLVRLAGERVEVVAIASRHDSANDIARFVREHAISFPVLRDVDGAAASRFGARRSPEAFVLDAGGRVRYRGRIDDNYGVGTRKGIATRYELRDAIHSVRDGRPVAVTVTDAPGCPLPVAESGRLSSSVTFSRDIAPILQRRCQACHRPGQSGPFSLLTFKDARDRAETIREVVEAGRMPPWGADRRHGTFANDPSLTPSEKHLILEWIEANCPEGDRQEMPAPRVFPENWTIPTPDVVLEMPQAFTVPAEGTVEYQYIRVDPGFREDRWIKAAEIQPGNPAVVHHCNIFLQPPGAKSVQETTDLGQLGSVCLTMMAQGTPPLVLRDGMAKRIPAGWQVVFVMHYQTVGRVQSDRTRLGLTFADHARVRQEVATKLLYDGNLRIPPHARDHRVVKEWIAEKDVLLLSMFPHMHLRGKSFRYELVRPDGSEEILLDVPAFDFGWQHRYELAQPLRVMAGERIRCSAIYDNSEDNLANPNPRAEVRAGSQSWDEMFNGYFDVCLADEDLTRAPSRWPLLAAGAACAAGLLWLTRRFTFSCCAAPSSSADRP